jgi:uncharacterized protein (TIGR02271 family)
MTGTNDTVSVVTANGQKGTADLAPAKGQERPGLVRVRLDTGRDLWVGPEMLLRQPDGHYLLPLAVPADADERVESMVVPVVEEEALVAKRTVQTGGVRVTKLVHERQEQVDTTTVNEEVEVHREAVGQFVDQPEPARSEGDHTVIPIYEEVVVVEKRLRLKERWVITKRRVETPGSEVLPLRREEAVVERLDPKAGSAPQQAG